MKKDTTNQNRLPLTRQKKPEGFTRKIEPLRGGLVREMIRCGRPNCKCAKGSLHGPYYYRAWMVRGKRFKKYVKKSELSAVRAGINERRRKSAEVRQFNQEAKQNWLAFKAQLRQLDYLLK
jgi:hypothetical protein